MIGICRPARRPALDVLDVLDVLGVLDVTIG
jgi:hypothetical protein